MLPKYYLDHKSESHVTLEWPVSSTQQHVPCTNLLGWRMVGLINNMFDIYSVMFGKKLFHQENVFFHEERCDDFPIKPRNTNACI